MVLKMFGSFWDKRWISPTWRPGFFYLTNKRLFLFRKEPAEVLLEVPLDKLEGLAINKEMHYKKEREELYIQYDCGEVVRIHVSNCTQLKDETEKTVGKRLEREIPIPYENPQYPLSEGEKIAWAEKLWYLFPAMGILGETWKPGRLYLTDKRLFWVYRVDNQKMFEVPLDKIVKASIGFNGKKPGMNAGEKVLTIAYDGGDALFGGNEQRLGRMMEAMGQMVPSLSIA